MKKVDKLINITQKDLSPEIAEKVKVKKEIIWNILFEFYKKFPYFKEADFWDFLLAVFFSINHSYVLDDILDEEMDVRDKVFNLKILNNSKLESTKILTKLFGEENDFWDFLIAREIEYTEAPILESKIKNYADFKRLVNYKHSIEKTAFFGIFVLGGKEIGYKDYNKIEQMIDDLYLGVQIFDDLIDFKKDVLQNRFNYFKWKFFPEVSQVNNEKEFLNIREALFLEGHAKSELNFAIKLFEDVKKKANDKKFYSFEKLSEYYIHNIKKRLEIIKPYLYENK